eukprot:4076-Heterococcus_DN1.PRE.1
MARKKAQRKQEATLMPHRAPDFTGLISGKDGASAQAVRAYLAAGGSPVAIVQGTGQISMLQLPLLHSIAYLNVHPHTNLAESVQLLLDAGADINAATADTQNYLCTPLMFGLRRPCCAA